MFVAIEDEDIQIWMQCRNQSEAIEEVQNPPPFRGAAWWNP
jgi:hypothetical protein